MRRTLGVPQGGERVRRMLVTCFVVMASLAAAAPAALAGGSWIDLREVDGQPVSAGPSAGPAWAPAGAVVTMQGAFCDGQLAPVSAGPWFAYLDPPGRSPMLLAPVEVAAAGGNGCPYLARTTFVVPEVAPGDYVVHVCDQGCHSGVGDLIGGFLTVASTGFEARLLGRLERYELKIDRLTDGIRAEEVDGERLEAAREARDEALVTLAAIEAANDRLTAQRDAALHGREAAEADVRATDRESRNWRIAAYLLALLVAVTWIVAWVRRRDTIRIKVPDTIEEIESADHRADR